MNTNRFNHNSNRKVKTEDTRGRRVEVVTGVVRCREWTDEKKPAIIAESCQDEAGSFALNWADGAKNISPFCTLIIRRTQTAPTACSCH